MWRTITRSTADRWGKFVAVEQRAAARRAPGELEAEVLAALWAAEGSLTAAEVQRELRDSPAYSTVVTILTRLHNKGVLRRHPHGRAYAYTPVADEPGLTARRMRQLLDARDDRQSVLARFVSDLSADDERLLRALLTPLPADGPSGEPR